MTDPREWSPRMWEEYAQQQDYLTLRARYSSHETLFNFLRDKAMSEWYNHQQLHQQLQAKQQQNAAYRAQLGRLLNGLPQGLGGALSGLKQTMTQAYQVERLSNVLPPLTPPCRIGVPEGGMHAEGWLRQRVEEMVKKSGLTLA